MARTTKGGTAANGKPAKVAKVAKRTTKAAEAEAPAKPAAPRGEYANRPYRVTEAGKAANPRGHRGERWAIVKAGKNTADFLGKPYTGADGAERSFTSAKLANFVERGFIEFTD